MLKELEGGLVVSCQALEGEPMHGSSHMASMALAAKEGGAAGIRANGPDDIKAIKKKVDLPVIGILKKEYPGFQAFITTTQADAKLIAEAGADIIAIDARNGTRVEELPQLIAYIKKDLNKLVMADVATLQEGVQAEALGCDMVGTTLSGYTENTKERPRPDFELMESLVNTLKVPVIAEGNVDSPEKAKKALDIGAAFVVVGGAITRPQLITRKFAERLKGK
ncbi:N-acetylmannosamine-6-phosphate 2-epimerase [Oceanobacillus neutriphilus]|uniref:Putative N-acetylmannosamine-6-phosphate 2-epimerase n=1 Tax=Oceanobacillus neutriphilus TaxID=531815 RepID=A0ABQ2NNT8_9BACI|nr:N-acetylmannosamine-6-phosphate 2-epimerase [Oceanobacillus neutriphilus]GGP07041.1 putative N-acetylmannosamine-6-phosphate 2-epimerase [Oceanobacillus neutriphilus]